MSSQPQPGSIPADSFRAGPIGTAAAILVGVAAVGDVLNAGSAWHDYAVFKDDSQNYDASGLGAIDAFYLIASVAAAVAFILWLRQVRQNAERFTKARHRHARGALIWGWLVPVANFWIPKRIVDDIVAASLPQTDPHTDELPRRRLRVVQVWWMTWIASSLIAFVDPAYLTDYPSSGEFLWSAIGSTASSVLTIVCALYAVRVIKLINQLQASRPRVAWWDVSTASAS
jgi:predicted membrane-bound dolichyl-phosphate-mannose-protein mannosyltransferase